ncbi:hypothetical protein E6W36_10925 [Hankyongella ginsenosidimutans]|uniref:Uncharacterized protein n=1 Tax=Hankyongella ginsenosidimutans TaxID=1763828 RepID=A0A4D7CBM0_9SPHN|nr:hypothetical protein E6W36_10925 [Hankyongella ginsenosidimutans]
MARAQSDASSMPVAAFGAFDFAKAAEPDAAAATAPVAVRVHPPRAERPGHRRGAQFARRLAPAQRHAREREPDDPVVVLAHQHPVLIVGASSPVVQAIAPDLVGQPHA